jgi:hypothetical protein
MSEEGVCEELVVSLSVHHSPTQVLLSHVTKATSSAVAIASMESQAILIISLSPLTFHSIIFGETKLVCQPSSIVIDFHVFLCYGPKSALKNVKGFAKIIPSTEHQVHLH